MAEANEECSLDRSEGSTAGTTRCAAAARRTPGAKLIDLTRFFCDEDRSARS